MVVVDDEVVDDVDVVVVGAVVVVSRKMVVVVEPVVVVVGGRVVVVALGLVVVVESSVVEEGVVVVGRVVDVRRTVVVVSWGVVVAVVVETFGPVETTRVTMLPRVARVPPAGLVAITTPAGHVRSSRRSCATLKPAACNAAVASLTFPPTSLGTAMVARPELTHRTTGVALRTDASAFGS